MLRANVYSIYDLSPTERDIIYDGIDQFAGLISETVRLEEKSTYTTEDELIALNPREIAPDLDWQVDLHMIVKPLRDAQRIGEAYIGRGIGFVDLSKCSKDLGRAVTAHETAHSIGLLVEGSSHADPDSVHHCADPSCLMHPRIKVNYPSLIKREHSDFTVENMAAGLEADTLAYDAELSKPSDFCYDCQGDLKLRGIGLLHALRISRMVDRKVSID